MARRNIFVLSFAIFLLHFGTINSSAQTSPYPNSEYITGINYNWSTHIRSAPGSDNWPITWADNDHQYTSWGDGGGFGGTDQLGRVSLGVARVEGTSASYTGYNASGGYNAENPFDVDGKSRGIICITGVLYMWVGPGSYPYGFNESRLYRSTNHAATWQRNDSWAFIKSEGIIMPGFLQFGKDYAGARDDYVYIYAQRYVNDNLQIPGKIDLMRVNKTQLLTRSAYEFYKGKDGSGNPLWTSDLTERQPVFEDPTNGVGRGLGVSVMFNPGLNRYILIVEHGEFAQGNMGVFEAAEPWGPWKTIVYQSGFGSGHVETTTFYWNISRKWLSTDGEDFVLIFTGISESDSWNTVEASFTISPIPIELQQFSADTRGKTSILKWTTISEVNSYGFEIERKCTKEGDQAINSEWQRIGFVPGCGNSNSIKEYCYVDDDLKTGNYEYRLRMIDADGSFKYSEIIKVSIDIPMIFWLEQNFPNPFNPNTKICWQMPFHCQVTLLVYDVLGKEIATLVDTEKEAGSYDVEFNAATLQSGVGLISGVYFYQLKAGKYISAKKMSLLK